MKELKTMDISKEEIVIENLIYEIRGKQVMLDSDLAKLYECANGTKTLNLAVKRHINRFPERFMFRLSRDEYYKILRFQSETLEFDQGRYSKYLPYVFTEQGVAMLATILRTKVAEEISIKIIDAYADKTILDIIKRLNVSVTIITKKDNLFTHQDIKKYNSQYHNLKVIYDNTFHDRYFMIDDQDIYHCGTSINRIGYKTFSINLIGDADVRKMLFNKVNSII